MPINKKKHALRNRTLTLTEEERKKYKPKLIYISQSLSVGAITNKIIHQDLFRVIQFLPEAFVDLLFIDPPYNLHKEFNSNRFKEMSPEEYEVWMDSWLGPLRKVLKPTASVYICGDWKSSSSIFRVMAKYFKIRNRITWEREKGRGAIRNWKNCSEDIWFGTVSNDYYFDSKAVMHRRRVIAPYRDESGKPKDWEIKGDEKYRNTYPSNIWTDITVPFWSMPENTEHPTQKPEKLLAKIILASSREGDFVFDPFAGVGTTCVVAKKLGRLYCGIEIDETYCCLAEKRLALASTYKDIQGYIDGVFWERNTLKDQKRLNCSQF